MSEEHPDKKTKWSTWRIVRWVIAGGILLLLLVNLFFPDLDLSTEDRIALVRIERMIVFAPLHVITRARKSRRRPAVNQYRIAAGMIEM